MKRRTLKQMMQPKKRARVSWQTLHVLWREIVFARAHYKCEYPGCRVNAKILNPHHVIGKRTFSTKYDPDNGLCLCSYHHTGGNDAVHAGSITFWKTIFDHGVRTEAWLERLQEKAAITVKKSTFDREAHKEYLEGILREVRKNNASARIKGSYFTSYRKMCSSHESTPKRLSPQRRYAA